MFAKIALPLIAAAVLVAATTLVVRENEERIRLKSEELRLERASLECARLERENTRLKADSRSGTDLAALHRKRAQIAAARNAIDWLDVRDRDLKRTLGVPVDPVWPVGAIVLNSNEWKFAGQRRPNDALESVLWAARAGDVDHLAGLIALEPEAQAKAKAMYDELPEASRQQYGSPEKVVATMIAGKMPADLAAMAALSTQNPGPDSALVDIRLEEGSGNQRDMTFKFEKDGEDWRMDVPARVVDNYARSLKAAVVAH